MKKTAVAIFLFLFLLTPITPVISSDSSDRSSNPFPTDTDTKSPADWLVLVYDDGDNSLTDFISDDIIEMTAGGSTGDFVMLILADFGYDRRVAFDYLSDNTTRDTNTSFVDDYERSILVNNKPGKLYYVKNNELVSMSIEDNLKIPSEPNMGDPNTLISFLNFGLNTYSAKNTMLILANHGVSFKGFMQDEYSKDYMTPDELRYALSTVGYHFSIIGFDACLMASASMLYEVSPYCDYVIASEMTEPGAGWDYTVFAELSNDPTITPLEFGKLVVDYYSAQYYPNIDYTIALYDTSKLVTAFMYFDDFVNSLLPIASKLKPLFEYLKFGSTYSIKEVYYSSDIYDIIAFLSSIEQYLIDSSLSDYATNIVMIRGLLLSTMKYYNYNSNINSDISCLSLYIPQEYSIDNSFQKTLFAEHFQWNELLYAIYVNPSKFKTEVPPSPIVSLNNSIVEVRLPSPSLVVQLYSPDNFGIGNTIYTITASINGNTPTNGFYELSSVTILSRIYDGKRYSGIVEQSFDNIEGVYIESPPEIEEYHLSVGWNIIGVGFEPDNTLTAYNLVNNYYGIDVIVKYDNINDTFTTYTEGMPVSADFDIESGGAYYIHTKSDVILTLYGRTVRNSVITLSEGWNFISIQSDTNAISLSNKIPGTVKIIYDPDSDLMYYAGYPKSSFLIKRNTGIWIYSIRDATFTIT